MATCVPISDLKDTTSFARKVAAAGEPVVVTRNGYEEFIVIDPVLFRSYRKETPEEQLERLLSEADHDITAGRFSKAKDGISEMRRAYGL